MNRGGVYRIRPPHPQPLRSMVPFLTGIKLYLRKAQGVFRLFTT